MPRLYPGGTGAERAWRSRGLGSSATVRFACRRCFATGQESRSADPEPHLAWAPWTSRSTRASRPTTLGVTMTGSSTQGIKTVLHPVSDVTTSKAVYAALLGVQPTADSSYYVGFETEGQHIGLVPGGG